MPYISKNADGQVVGVFACAQYDGQEFDGEAIIFSPGPAAVVDPVEKLKAFIASNPDVAALLK